MFGFQISVILTLCSKAFLCCCAPTYRSGRLKRILNIHLVSDDKMSLRCNLARGPWFQNVEGTLKMAPLPFNKTPNRTYM